MDFLNKVCNNEFAHGFMFESGEKSQIDIERKRESGIFAQEHKAAYEKIPLEEATLHLQTTETIQAIYSSCWKYKPMSKAAERMKTMENIFDAIESNQALQEAKQEATEEVSFDNAKEAEVLEKAPPMEIQAMEIRDYFIEQPELQYENWKELSFEERVEALGKLEAHMAEVGKRPAARIVTDLSETGRAGKKLKMEYLDGLDPRGNYMFCARELLEDNSLEGYTVMMADTFYKSRHLYQAYNVYETPVESNKELVEAWRQNLTGNIGYQKAPSEMESRERYEYMMQPVEVDARSFSMTMIDKLNLKA